MTIGVTLSEREVEQIRSVLTFACAEERRLKVKFEKDIQNGEADAVMEEIMDVESGIELIEEIISHSN